MMARAPLLAALVVTTLLLSAAPAWADPATPTHYRSVVNSLEPTSDGVVVSVQGGDAFLHVSVAPGHQVEIPGYFGEPYIRIDATGDVWRNERSPARFINVDRYGLSGVPEHADAAADPEWRRVGDGGRYDWHDHRVHWMSRDLPPTISGHRAEIVFPWSITIIIDGLPTEVRGELLWFPSVNPLGAILTGAVGVLGFLAWKTPQLRPLPALAALFGSLTLYVAIAQHAATPAADRGSPAAATVLVVAIVAGVAAMRSRRPSAAAWRGIMLAGLGFVWWAWTALDALTAPILPSGVPSVLERGVVAGAFWIGLALVGIAGVETARILRDAPAATKSVALLEGSIL